MPAPIPPWISASEAPTTWIFRMARNAPIVAPTTATQVLNDTSSAAGAAERTASPAWGTPGDVSAVEPAAMVRSAPQGARGVEASASDGAGDAAHTPVRGTPVPGLVSIDASTDIPGRRVPTGVCPGSRTIFTGTRCTILVKLPVALSGGSRLNSRPLAGAKLSTQPRR